jgi:tetratricopeptide (TPR) repeat protein
MAKDLKRGDLKRNELGEAIHAGVEYAEGHLRSLLLGIGGVVVVGLLVWGIWAWRASRLASANELLGSALRAAQAEIVATGAKPEDPVKPTFATAAARDAKARELFTKVTDKYGSTGAAAAARLWLGDRALESGDRAEARRLWQQVREKSDGSLAAAARLDLARLDRLEGKNEALSGELKRELEEGTGPVPADALLAELARTYEAMGKSADATATWRRLITEHPDSAYADLARQQLGTAGPAA